MACNTTLRNNLANGHRKRGSAAMAVAEDESRTGCCEGTGSTEHRYKETRVDELRHITPSAGADMPQQRYEDCESRVSVGTSSGVGGVSVGIGVGEINGGGGMGREVYGRGREEQRGERIEEQNIGGHSVGDRGDGRGRRKLILHFDIRNTILVADSVTRVKVEQALNTFLTGVTWGREVDNDWKWLSNKPSLGPPCDGAITYYKHLESRLARTPDDRALLRQETGNFTQDELGKDFRSDFEYHLRRLRWDHDDPDKMLTMVGCDNCRYHYLLPSFVRLLYKLHADGRDFAIVLRTYGMDASNVLACLKYIVNGNHPDFAGLSLPIDVRTNPGRVRRHEDGRVEFEVGKEGGSGSGGAGGGTDTETIYDDELQIYDMLSRSRGITGFVDDFVYWQKNGYDHGAGKPFWINLEDDAVQHIFFDDNIRVTADDSIVDVRLARPTGSGFESIDLNRMSELEDACLVQADLLNSIDNVEYFVEKVRTCERNYRRLTSSTDFEVGRRSRSRSLEEWDAA